MSLFAPHAYDALPAPRRRGGLGWALVSLAFGLVIVLGLVPSPYVIEQPGPVFDTLGVAEHEGGERPLINIPDAETFDSTGELNLLTVSVVGNPENLPHWLDVATAWVDPSKSVVPVESVFPPNLSTEERNEENRVLMINSQRDAVAAALTELGYDIPRTLSVESILQGSPATDVLEPGDRITSIEDEPVVDLADLRRKIGESAGAPIELGLLRDGTAMTLDVLPEIQDGAAVIGVLIATDYTFPFEVDIQLDDVGGPSAGMIFALGIIEKLGAESLTGGESFAGTGTIDAQGNVGPIGGIRQKLYGAERAGAEYFLAPVRNCDEVVGHVPDGLEVFAVSTLDDSLDVLNAVTEGSSIAELPRCTASSQN